MLEEFEEIVENGVVYVVNKETGEKIKKSDVATSQINEINTEPNIPVKTPLAVQETGSMREKFNQNLNNQADLTTVLQGALSNQAEGTVEAGNTAKDSLKNFDALTLPTMEEKQVMRDDEGNQISFQDALPQFSEWKEKTGWKIPDRTDDQYQVDKEDFKYEQTDRQRFGGQLQILGAMFQELGNPKLYKGQTAAVSESVLARKESGEDKALEAYQEAMAVAKSNYEGDVDNAKFLLDTYQIDVKDVQNQIDAIESENAQIQQDFDNAITIFDSKVKQFTKANEVVLDKYDLEIANLEVLPSVIKESLTARVDFGNAIVEGMNLRDKMVEINQAEATLVQSLSKDFKAMNTPSDARYGLSWNEKLSLLMDQAGDSEIAKKFVNAFPDNRADYDKAETTNFMHHAEQILVAAEAIGLPDEFKNYILAEKVMGVKVGNLDTTASSGLKYSDEDIDTFVSASESAKKVYDTASSIQQKINNGTYSASGIDKFIADSKLLNALNSVSEAAGFQTDIQARFEELKKSTGGTQQAMAGLIVELIPQFTGEEGARKTTFDVTYTGEAINSLKQQFDEGLLTTNEGQLNALEIIKNLARDSAIYNYKQAAEGKPIEPTDQFFADIDAKYSGGGTETSINDEDRANFNRLLSNAGTTDSLRSMFSKPDMKAQVKNDIELKKDLMKQIRSSNPDLSISEAQALLDELLN